MADKPKGSYPYLVMRLDQLKDLHNRLTQHIQRFGNSEYTFRAVEECRLEIRELEEIIKAMEERKDGK